MTDATVRPGPQSPPEDTIVLPVDTGGSVVTLDEILVERLEDPQFAVSMRGYDRGQVDDYILRLRQFLTDAERRFADVEQSYRALQAQHDLTLRELADERSELPVARYDGLGQRVDQILQLAREEADALVRAAREQGDRLLAGAREQIGRDQEIAQAALATVSARRDAVVEEIRRLRDLLTDADPA
jgi:DivIVA domain-containing protein